MSDTTDILAASPVQDASTTTPTSTEQGRPRRRRVGLSTMLLSELQAVASELGITGIARMRKGDLIAAIEAHQGGGSYGAPRAETPGTPAGTPATSPADPPYTSPADAPYTSPAEPPYPIAAAPADAVAPASAPADAEALASAPVGAQSPILAQSPPPLAATSAGDAPPSVADQTPVPGTGPETTGQGTIRQEGPRRVASRPAGSPGGPTGPTATAPVETDADRPPRDSRQRQDGDRPRGERSADTERTDRIDRGGVDRQRPDRYQNGERAERPAGDGERGERGGPDRQRGERNDRQRADRPAGDGDRQSGDRGERAAQSDRNQNDRNQGDRNQGDRNQGDRNQGDRNQNDRNQGDRNQNDRASGGAQRTDQGQRDRQGGTDSDEDGYDGGRRRRGRFRDRRRGRNDRFSSDTPEPVIAEDDVLLPVAGILDILDSYAFVRTSGYLTGPNDIYVSLAQVRRYGLRRGDAVTGAVRQPRDGERRDKYNALVRLDTINGMDPEQVRSRPEFTKLTPLYPQDRLRLETEPHLITPRIIDLVMPIGKGQRALIVSPPKAGKTMILQAIANAITTNNPECHLMVVLVDERPEEVTDMQRAVKGEVIASTFDRPPTDHTTVAELSIERAKRLVELGHDVVVLLDNITRLGRAYNLAAPASGRILSGGVDSTALYPPKRFLGAARNIEHGGSLTILATALIETGSTMDTVIFEEFKGTGNAELVLSRKIADRRVFPAVDVIASGTRKEEILLAPEELVIVHKLRRVLHALDPQQALDLLLDKVKQTRTNVEFLMQIQKTTVGPQD